MIVTGFIGAKVIDEGTNVGALVLWGIISTVFYVYLYVALWPAMQSSLSEMGPEAGTSLRNGTILLLTMFGVYPLVYAIPVFFDTTPRWTTTIQLAFSAADITAKVGFGVLMHKVAKLRTAEDLAAGIDTLPETIWISQIKHSDGVQPVLAGIRDGGSPYPTGDDHRGAHVREEHVAAGSEIGARAASATDQAR